VSIQPLVRAAQTQPQRSWASTTNHAAQVRHNGAVLQGERWPQWWKAGAAFGHETGRRALIEQQLDRAPGIAQPKHRAVGNVAPIPPYEHAAQRGFACGRMSESPSREAPRWPACSRRARLGTVVQAAADRDAANCGLLAFIDSRAMIGTPSDRLPCVLPFGPRPARPRRHAAGSIERVTG